MSLFATSRPRMSKRDMIEGAQRRHPDATIADAVKIDNNTLVYCTHENGDEYVSLHDTDIVRFWNAGTKVTIDTGGYNTHTTRARLNDVLDEYRLGSVYTSKGVIYHRWNGTSTPFHQRLVIDREKKTVRPDRKIKLGRT
jgi:hypothetical protein